ncbi:MAG TPA: hypothetical protein VHQ41_02955, partial [Patescibacteria group bacterium]|nr:hypothetical protein [Patescibacteria group bacterium]
MGNNNPRIPHVRICQKCGLHGHFTIPANDYSLDFCSIDQGMAFLDQEIANRNLIGYNISVLRRQIMSCGLPAEHTSVPEELLWKIEQWNDDHQACRN